MMAMIWFVNLKKMKTFHLYLFKLLISMSEDDDAKWSNTIENYESELLHLLYEKLYGG